MVGFYQMLSKPYLILPFILVILIKLNPTYSVELEIEIGGGMPMFNPFEVMMNMNKMAEQMISIIFLLKI
jgi:hypothetical protein